MRNWTKIAGAVGALALLASLTPTAFASGTIFNYSGYSNQCTVSTDTNVCNLLQNYGVVLGTNTASTPALTIGSNGNTTSIFSSIAISENSSTGAGTAKTAGNGSSTDFVSGPIDFSATQHYTNSAGTVNTITANSNVAAVNNAVTEYKNLSTYWSTVATGGSIFNGGAWTGGNIDISGSAAGVYIYTMSSAVTLTTAVTFNGTANQMIIINDAASILTFNSGSSLKFGAGGLSYDQVLFNIRTTSGTPLNIKSGTTTVDADFILNSAVTYTIATNLYGRVYGGNTGTFSSGFEAEAPEPGTWVMLLTGIALLGAGNWKRKKSLKKS